MTDRRTEYTDGEMQAIFTSPMVRSTEYIISPDNPEVIVLILRDVEGRLIGHQIGTVWDWRQMIKQVFGVIQQAVERMIREAPKPE